VNIQINSTIADKDVELEGYIYLIHEGEYYRGCRRCGGTGHYSFDGYSSECYECGNSSARYGVCVGTLEQAQKDAMKRAKAKAAREAKKEQVRLAKLAKREEAQLAVKAVAPEIYEFLMSEDAYNSRIGFIASMASKFQYHIPEKKWTEKMTDAVRRHLVQLAEREGEALAHPVLEGRIVIRGEIMSAKFVENDFGTAYKILVKDERGFKVWGTLPKAQADQARDEYVEALLSAGKSIYDFGPDCWFLGADGTDETGVKGRGITFTATVVASDDDKNFGFFSRPSKGEWIAA